MKVTRIANKPIPSNCYILEPKGKDSPCIVIDPGTIDTDELLAFFSASQLYPEIVFLTHEHFDHCAGVDALAKDYNFRLMASEQTAVSIKNSKTNFSAYFEAIEPFEILYPVEIVKESDIVKLEKYEIRFLETPGHSPGSICLLTNALIFTGDTLLNGVKTPVRRPHGNKSDYRNSLCKLKKTMQPGMQVFPGHGTPFVYEKWIW